MVIEYNDTSAGGAMSPLDPARPWLTEAATFIDVRDEPDLAVDLQVFCSYRPDTGLAVNELGIVLRDGVTDLGTSSPAGIDLRDVVRRAIRSAVDDSVDDAAIEEVLPRDRSDTRTLRIDADALTVRPVVDPWSTRETGATGPVATLVTPDLCVPNSIQVVAQDQPDVHLELAVTLVLDLETARYRVVHVVVRHHLSASADLGADPLRSVDLAGIVRRALVGIAPTSDAGPTLESFMPLP